MFWKSFSSTWALASDAMMGGVGILGMRVQDAQRANEELKNNN